MAELTYRAAVVLREIRRLGADLFSTSEAENAYLVDDPKDPSRKMIRQILGVVSEYERSMIAVRLRSARDRKKAHGGYAGFGSPAYGFRAEGGETASSLASNRCRRASRMRRLLTGWMSQPTTAAIARTVARSRGCG